jgi:ribonucleoside-diphosphate reductase alpha chain
MFRWMGLRFLTTEEQAMAGITSHLVPTSGAHEEDTEDAIGSVREVAGNTGEKARSVSKMEEKVTHLRAVTSKSNGSNGNGVKSVAKTLPYVLDDAPPCTTCGSSMMVRQGACYRCLNCGSQGGCG